MRITYDPVARAAYVYINNTPVLSTRNITDQVNVDTDLDANAVGVEILFVDMPTVEVLQQPASVWQCAAIVTKWLPRNLDYRGSGRRALHIQCGRLIRSGRFCFSHKDAAPAAEPPGAVPVCEDCGMRHDPDDKASCIEGHGEP